MAQVILNFLSIATKTHDKRNIETMTINVNIRFMHLHTMYLYSL